MSGGLGRRTFCAGVCGLAALVACGRNGEVLGGATDAPDSDADTDADADADTDPSAVETACDPTALPDPDDPGWVAYPLVDFPELAEIGGQSILSDPDHLLEAVVVHVREGCFITAWRICPHGACEVAWRPDARDLWCPCHASRFDATGGLLQGPARRDLRTFPTEVRGDRLRIHRPT